MESKIILQFQEILYDRSWEKSKKLPFSKQTQAKTALFTSETKNGGVQKGRNKSGILALQKRGIVMWVCRTERVDVITYQLQMVPSQQRQLLGHVFQLQFHWRRCWRNRHHLQWFCQMAFVRQVGFHVPDSIIPSKRYQFGHQLGQYERR